MTTSGTGFTGGCQSTFYIPFLNAYVICDMSGTQQHGFFSTTLTSALSSWTQFNFVYTQQYIYQPDDVPTIKISSGANYVIRSHSNGNVEYSTNGTTWSALTLPSGTVYFNSWFVYTSNFIAAGQFLGYNGNNQWTPSSVLTLPPTTNTNYEEGQIWYDATTSTLKCYIGGALKTITVS